MALAGVPEQLLVIDPQPQEVASSSNKLSLYISVSGGESLLPDSIIIGGHNVTGLSPKIEFIAS